MLFDAFVTVHYATNTLSSVKTNFENCKIDSKNPA